MDPVHESSPCTRSKVGVHGPLVHVLSSPLVNVTADQPLSEKTVRRGVGLLLGLSSEDIRSNTC